MFTAYIRICKLKFVLIYFFILDTHFYTYFCIHNFAFSLK